VRLLRSAALAIGLTLAPVMILSGCASFEQVQPTSARQALAEAEISFIGILQVSNQLEALIGTLGFG